MFRVESLVSLKSWMPFKSYKNAFKSAELLNDKDVMSLKPYNDAESKIMIFMSLRTA